MKPRILIVMSKPNVQINLKIITKLKQPKFRNLERIITHMIKNIVKNHRHNEISSLISYNLRKILILISKIKILQLYRNINQF